MTTDEIDNAHRRHLNEMTRDGSAAHQALSPEDFDTLQWARFHLIGLEVTIRHTAATAVTIDRDLFAKMSGALNQLATQASTAVNQASELNRWRDVDRRFLCPLNSDGQNPTTPTAPAEPKNTSG